MANKTIQFIVKQYSNDTNSREGMTMVVVAMLMGQKNFLVGKIISKNLKGLKFKNVNKLPVERKATKQLYRLDLQYSLNDQFLQKNILLIRRGDLP